MRQFHFPVRGGLGWLVLVGRIGVVAPTVEANAAPNTIVFRDTVESYRQMLLRMASEGGVEAVTAEDLVRMDRKHRRHDVFEQGWAVSGRSRGEDCWGKGRPDAPGVQVRARGGPRADAIVAVGGARGGGRVPTSPLPRTL